MKELVEKITYGILALLGLWIMVTIVDAILSRGAAMASRVQHRNESIMLDDFVLPLPTPEPPNRRPGT